MINTQCMHDIKDRGDILLSPVVDPLTVSWDKSSAAYSGTFKVVWCGRTFTQLGVQQPHRDTNEGRPRARNYSELFLQSAQTIVFTICHQPGIKQKLAFFQVVVSPVLQVQRVLLSVIPATQLYKRRTLFIENMYHLR